MLISSTNNRFWSFLKTSQISFFIAPELDLVETLAIKKSKLKIRKKYCKLYASFVQTQLEKNLKKHFRKNWILPKDQTSLKKTKKTKIFKLDIKTNFNKFHPLHIKSYTSHYEFIYGFKKQSKYSNLNFINSWDMFQKFKDKT